MSHDPNAAADTGSGDAPKRHTAGAFDIRNIIGLLLLIYGVILTATSLLHSGDERTGGINANLWTGLALLVLGAVFMVWARMRPIMVPEGEAHAHDDEGPPPGH